MSRGERRPRPGRSDDPQALGSVLDALEGGRPLAAGLVLGQLGRRWEAVVGERLAQECWPASLDGGVLVVRATSAAWAAQVTFLAAAVRDRANEVLGLEAVGEVRATVRDARGGG